MADIPPNQTLYIQNLNNRIHPLELQASLYSLFTTYGHILDVRALSTEKLREQAFVAFVDVAAATTAMRSLDGFVFYGKPMKIQYAKNKSDAVALLDGTFKLRTKKPTSTTLG
ncbi:SNRPB2 protein, partial [Halteromyces radiatus]|uniref:SNRPB2 protein n=1 Tax=Halteromyces radiatus TaxID=101107 RepID=UPI00221ECBFC